MSALPYSPMPSSAPSKRASSARGRRNWIVAAAAAALAASGLLGYSLGRRSAATPAAAPIAASAAPATPAFPPPAAALPTPTAPPDAPAASTLRLDDYHSLLSDGQFQILRDAADDAEDARRDVAVLHLESMHIRKRRGEPPVPASIRGAVDGVPAAFPVRTIVDGAPQTTHWSLEIRVPHREVRHRLVFKDAAFVWDGAAWTQTK